MTAAPTTLADALADRYRLEHELGQGGMATVYLAEDVRHRRKVAVKVLRPELSAALGPDRFLREIHVAAGLSHPYIVALYDSGQADGFLYYVMPLIEGETLRQRLARTGKLPMEEAIEVARNVAAALSYAHGTGVVHRDIKPENIMLHQGQAMVADFGIAKAVSAASSDRLTQTGSALGTPAYMSPEQAGGESEIDGRSDIYSLGCVLYEMLTGSHPFSAPTVQAVLLKHLTAAPPSVRAVRPVPESLDRAVARAMAKTPGERFATAAAFAQALHSGATPPAGAPVTQVVTPAVRSIAVLPFVDMSPERNQEYFCEGVAEELINALMRVDDLHVASRTSAFAYRGATEDIREIGRKLEVETVLEGSVRKSGDRLRISAQLLKVADGYQLWSERYDRQLEDVFEIQDEIAQNITKALRVVMTDRLKRAAEKAPTDNFQAYEYYLRGLQFFHEWRRRSVEHARRMFERAIDVDPNYALAHAGVAMCCAYVYTYWDASTGNLEQARAASKRALELNPESAEAHTALGLTLANSKHYEEAAAAYEAAIRIEPKLFDAHYFLGRLRLQQGQQAEAVQSFLEACRLQPEDYQAPFFLAMAYKGSGQEAEAAEVGNQALASVERHLELHPDDTRALNLGATQAAYQGQREKAADWCQRALLSDPEDSGLLYNVACVYSILGELEPAVDCLEKAVHFGFGLGDWVRNDPDLQALHGHPRFEAILAGI